ncbi:c-type cytochrome [Desulfuromonas versatilis]|uniref:C-type cytochrome n=1 Tax=Desulfuromonas versatilis TaxID=2802975 RepID=A0ABM8I2P1_9BACT|nr:cytochrome C [Desulfuromonas versatilis]BCR07047.1 c-type cytochrome [Desulfuromonas versatilis]
MKKTLLPLILICSLAWGCAMLGSWKAIPAPGGCDQCHTQPIGNDWQLAYEPPTLTSETGREAWQSSGSMAPAEASPLEQQKISEQRCFRCHKGPDKAHTEYKGRYHH